MSSDQRNVHGRFISGNSGGPGRPSGARNRLSEAFLNALHDDWTTHGLGVLDRVRSLSPAAYLRVVASLVPARLDIAPADESTMTDEELRKFIAGMCEEMGFSGVAAKAKTAPAKTLRR